MKRERALAGWLDRLLGWADQDLVDAYPLGLRHGVDDGVGYVLGLEYLQVQEPAQALPRVLVGDVVGELRGDGPGLDDGHADVVLEQLLAQALGDGADGVLAAGVDAA